MAKDQCRRTSAAAVKSSSAGGARAKRATTASATSSGCMSAVRQFFDFHHFQFCLNPSPPLNPSSPLTLPHDNHSTVLKGMEAPRNSLDLETEDEEMEVSVLSSSRLDENLPIPMGMQIKTSCNGDQRRSTSVDLSSSSEISPSPGTKTPTLVARLMGLDLLPDSCSSPSSASTVSSIYATPPTSTKKSHLRRLHQRQQGPGTRSLPETPRVSSSSSRRSVDADHRLSLQINKENATEAFEFSRFTSMRRNEMKCRDENRSPSEYARQILKQVKESVSKRVGLADITNGTASRNQEQRRDQELLIRHLKLKKSSKAGAKLDDQSSPAKNSPRMRFLEYSKNKATITTTSHSQSVPSKPLSSLSLSSPAVEKPKPAGPLQEKQKESKKVGGGERFRSRLVKKPPQKSDIVRKNKQEEPFVRPASTSIRKTAGNVIPDHNKSKKTPLSSDLVNTGLIPVKKDHPSPVTKIVVLQSQVYDADAARESRQSSLLRGCLSHEYKQTHTARDSHSSKLNGGAATAGDGGAEHEYVMKILNRTGIHKDTPVLSFTSWFSPSRPLDSSLFHQLELSYHPSAAAAATTTVSDRKLLFHLVDEMLVEILRPHVHMNPWCNTNKNISQSFGGMRGSELVDTLCSKIRGFPARECSVLGDIDAIVDEDLSEWKMRNLTRVGLEDEGERIVREIEKDVVDSLVQETAVSLCRTGRDGWGRRNGAVWV